MNLDKPIPIGFSEAGSAFSKAMCDVVDYGMLNVHPCASTSSSLFLQRATGPDASINRTGFGSVAVNASGLWTSDFYDSFGVKVCAYAAASGKKTYLGEFVSVLPWPLIPPLL